MLANGSDSGRQLINCTLNLLHSHPLGSLLQRLEVDERAVFLKFELFAKRLGKLCEMFTSIHQISGLEQHTHITGARRAWRLHCCPCFC